MSNLQYDYIGTMSGEGSRDGCPDWTAMLQDKIFHHTPK